MIWPEFIVPLPEVSSAVQITLPDASAVSAPPLPSPEQLKLASRMPPVNVDVAVEVLRRDPPVIVSPAEADREVAPIPPENVELAVDVLRIEPVLIVSPPVEESPTAEIPPENVELAEEVLRIDPPVIVNPLAETNPPPLTESPEAVNVEVAADVL